MFARPRARLIALVLGCASLMGVAVPMSASVSASSANIQNQVNALFDELDRLEAQMDVASERYAEAVAMQDDLKQQIIDSEARVAQKESELSTMRRDLVKVAQQAFMNGGRSNSLT
ncbi:MAG: coiled-coil domain-containing protein, partial [Actinomycetota bacterium]